MIIKTGLLLSLLLFAYPVNADEHDLDIYNDEKNPPPQFKVVPPQVPKEAPDVAPERVYGQPLQIPIHLICNDSKVIHEYLKNDNQQVPVIIGFKNNQHGVKNLMYQIYVNPETKRFSIVQHTTGGYSCFLGTGGEFDMNLNRTTVKDGQDG